MSTAQNPKDSGSPLHGDSRSLPVCACGQLGYVTAERDRLREERDRLREDIAFAAGSLNDHKARGLLYDNYALAVLEEALDA